MYYVDHLKNKPRTMPYLDCGTSGVALAFIEVYKDGNESMEFLNEEFLRRLSQGSDMVCTFNGGLFGGYVGLLPAAIALRDLGIDDELWERIIDGLNLYLMKNNGNIVFPGLYGYKCSMDLGTGSAGVLLALSDSGRSGEWDLGCRFWKMRIFRFSVFENSYCCWLGDGLYVMQCVAIFVCLGVKVSDDVFGKTNKNRYRGQ